MDPNLQNVLLGLLTNGLTAFIAQIGQKDSKMLLGEELLKKIKWNETAFQPILKKAINLVSESIEWQGLPTVEIVCLFLTSPEAEVVVRQIYASKLSLEDNNNIALIRKEFLNSFYFFVTSYSSYEKLTENQLVKPVTMLLNTLIDACEQALNIAVDEGSLSAHEAKSTFRHRLILEELASLKENVAFLTSQQKLDIKEILSFEETYRRMVGNRHKYITSPNIDKVRKLLITKLYVSPDLLVKRSYDKEQQQLQLFSENEQKMYPLAYEHVLSGTFRAVLLGNPGGGKSTFANKLCYDLVTYYSKRFLGRREKITPILVILRDYGAEKRVRSCSIVDFIKTKAKTDYQLQPPEGAFEYLLLNGRVMVIFDGLDELLDTRDRQEISADVESFCSLYSSVPVLVTSREVGYEQAPLDEERFEVLRLAPFNDTQVQEYVIKWFSTITELTIEQQKQKTESFLKESSIIPDLRSNPLMLALLCNIYKEENYIPKNRPGVYDSCANMLFERWDRSRGIQVSLPYEIHLRPTMMHLAYWIYSTEGLRAGVTENRLISETAKYLSQKLIEDEAQYIASVFVDFCKGRAWVFTNTGSTKQGEELYQFTHQTFLEYFTAAYLCRVYATPKELGNILQVRILNREWDVVAQLAVQIQNRNLEGAGDELLSMLIKQYYETANSKNVNILSFVVRCLEFILPKPDVVQEIILACIKFTQEWVKIHSNKEQLVEPSQSIEPGEILGDLLRSASENHKIIALKMKNLLINQVETANEMDAVVAFEIALDLPTFLFSKSRSALSELFQIGHVYDEQRNYWQRLSDSIVAKCLLQGRNFSKNNFHFSVKLLLRKEVSINEFIEWHGLEKIFCFHSSLIEPHSQWVSLAGSIINRTLSFYESELLKDLGSILYSHALPCIQDLNLNFDMATLGLPKPLTRKRKHYKETPFFMEEDVVFSFCVLAFVIVELSKSYKLDKKRNNVFAGISSDNHPLIKNIKWILLARYNSGMLNKAQRIIKKYNFVNEHELFVRQWIENKISFVKP